MDYTIVTIVVVTSRGRGFGDSALGEGVPDRVQRYPVFVWGYIIKHYFKGTIYGKRKQGTNVHLKVHL